MTSQLFIDQNTKTTEGRKIIEFRSFQDCKEYDGQIILLTDRRKFILIAGKKEEREMWMAGFNFVKENNKHQIKKQREIDETMSMKLNFGRR